MIAQVMKNKRKYIKRLLRAPDFITTIFFLLQTSTYYKSLKKVLIKETMSDDDLNNIEKLINKKIKLFLYLCLVTYLSYLAVYCSLDYLKFKEKVNNNLNKYVEKLLSHIDEQILIYRSVLSNTKASLSALKIEQNDKYHSAVSSILHLQTQILRQFSTNNQAMLVLKIIKCNSDYTETSVYGVLHSDYKPICEVLNGKNTAQFVYKLISDQSVNGNVLLYICTKVGNEQSKLGYACIINSVDDIVESKTQEDGSQVSIIDSKEEEIEKDFIGIRRLLYSTDNNIGIQIKIASKNYYNTLVLRILAHFKLSMIVLTILLMSLSMLYILIITKVKKVDRYIKMGRTAEQEMRLLRKFLKSRNIELLQDIKATIQLLTASNIEDKLVILPSYRKKLLRKIELAASGLLTKDYVSTRVNVSVTDIFNRNIKILAKSIFLRNITIKQNASAKDIVCADPLLLQQVILSVLHYVINNLQKGGQLIISVSKVQNDTHGVLITLEDNAFGINIHEQQQDDICINIEKIGELISLYNWKFFWESELYKGNKFSLLIPGNDKLQQSDSSINNMHNNIVQIF